MQDHWKIQAYSASLARAAARRMMVYGIALAAVLCGSTIPGQAQDKELVIVASGGSFERALRKNFYDAFTATTGIKVRAVAANYSEQWAKARAMAQSGQTEWDIVTVGVGEDVSNRELLLQLDCKAMPNMATDAIPNACRDYTVLRTIGGTVLAYNTHSFPKDKAPRSWKDFWDVKAFPGPRALPNYGAPYIPLALALLADDVPLSGVRNAPLDLGRAFTKLDAIKPNVTVWWKTGDQSQQSFRSGEIVLSMMWSGRVLQLRKEGVPIDIVWDGASAELSQWGVLKNAPNKEAAIQFLNFFATRPEAHLAFSEEVFWDTINSAALQKSYGSVDVFLKRLDSLVLYDNTWLAANRASLTTRWNEWISR